MASSVVTVVLLAGAAHIDAAPSRAQFTPGAAAWDALECGDAAEADPAAGAPLRISLAPGPEVTVGRISPQAWATPPVGDPGWQLTYYSLRWLKPAAKRAYDVGDRRTFETILAQVRDFYRDHPDPGTIVPGWDEGQALRRLETVTCFYALTGDRSLAEPMATDVAVQFGPRYYGPPYRAVHNHGLLANLRILRAAGLLDRTDWAERASARIRSEATLAFTPAGTTMEQSAAYQRHNRDLWAQAADELAEADPTDPAVAQVRDVVERATDVTQWLTEPDGQLVQIGDSALIDGLRAPDRAERTLRDDDAGLVVGRWSWRDPHATYYTLRYGPARAAHGHHDKGAVTWSARGARILVGPGLYGYDWEDPYAARQRAHGAHNTAEPANGVFDAGASATVAELPGRQARHSWRLSDRVHGVPHTRRVDVADDSGSLTVTDTYPERTTLRQTWHLAPTWRLVADPLGENTATATDPDGRRLTLTTTGRITASHRGSTDPVAGWHYPAHRRKVPAQQITVTGVTTVRTVFTVSDR